MKTSVVALFVLLLLSCGDAPPEQPPRPPAVSTEPSLTPCEGAFSAAVSVSAMQDSHRDLFPAFTACETLHEFERAAVRFPAAIPIDDTQIYATNLCSSYPADLQGSNVCESIQERTAAAAPPSGLRLSSTSGMLGVPLPEGARLQDRGSGPAPDRWERYAVAASASEIEGFFQRAMVSAGWVKDTILPGAWIKGQYLIAISSSDGAFTIRGS